MSTHNKAKLPLHQCISCGHSRDKVTEQLNRKREELAKLEKQLEEYETNPGSVSQEEFDELDAQMELVNNHIDSLKEQKKITVVSVTDDLIDTMKSKRSDVEKHFKKAKLKQDKETVEKLDKEMAEALASIDSVIRYYQSANGSSSLCQTCLTFYAEATGVSLGKKNLPAVIENNTQGHVTVDMVPKPRDFRMFLDKYVIGQNTAKAYISGTVALHYRRAADMLAGNRENFSKSNILLIGPTGVGKTAILRALKKCLSKTMGTFIPLASKSVTKVTEAGYVGENAEDVVEELFQKSLNHVMTVTQAKDINQEVIEQAVQITQLGIAHLDELDKIADTGGSEGGSVSRKGAQNALLTMLEGDIVTVKVPAGPGQVIPVEIDTSTILFVCSGAFMSPKKSGKSIYDIANARKGTGDNSAPTAGMLATITQATNDKAENYAEGAVDDIEPADVVEYGLSPEFSGRLPNIITLSKLSVGALARIVVEPTDAILPEYIRDMKSFYDINIMLSEDGKETIESIDNPAQNDTLKAIGTKANERNTGARAIQGVVNRITFFVTNFPEKLEGKHVLIDQEAVEDPQKLKVFDKIGGQFTTISELLAPTLAKIGEKDAEENGEPAEDSKKSDSAS